MTEINTPALALVAGLITSIHCAGMCGPIACSLTALKKEESDRISTAVAYHGGRLISYGSIGALFGTIGDRFLIRFFNSPAVVLPWFLVIIFIAIAFGLEKKIPRPAFFNRWMARLRFKALRLSATRGALMMGLATPILPCAPLYLLFAACLTTGNAIRGAEFALAFGLGTTPLLWATQHGMQKLQLKLGAKWMPRFRKGLALTAALMMAWRLHDTIPFFPSATAASPSSAPTATDTAQPMGEQSTKNTTDSEEKLPSCCH